MTVMSEQIESLREKNEEDLEAHKKCLDKLYELNVERAILRARDNAILINKYLERRQLDNQAGSGTKTHSVKFSDACAKCRESEEEIEGYLNALVNSDNLVAHNQKIEESTAQRRYEMFQNLVISAKDLEERNKKLYKKQFLGKYKMSPWEDLSKMSRCIEILLNEAYGKILVKKTAKPKETSSSQ